MSAYDRSAGYARVEEEVARRLLTTQRVSIELTGASAHTGRLLERLQQRYAVRLVHVLAPLQTCLERVNARDASSHLPASETMIRQVHAISTSLDLDYDLSLDNAGATDADLLDAFRTIL